MPRSASVGSGATSRYSKSLALVSMEEFDLALDAAGVHGEQRRGGCPRDQTQGVWGACRASWALCQEALSCGMVTGSPISPHPRPAGAKRKWLRFQYRVRLVVESSAFNNLFLVGILANSLVLAMEHDGMSHDMETALGTANQAFTALFCVELAAKVLGLGPWTYITDAWNLFDAIVVAVRWVTPTRWRGGVVVGFSVCI